MRILRTVLCVLLLAPALLLGAARVTPEARALPAAPSDAQILQAIDRYRAQTVHLRRVMGMSSGVRLFRRGTPSAQRALFLWRQRVSATRRRFNAGPPHYRSWMCIHRYEGSWTDPAAPYYGGLQMDISFQRSYGDVLYRKKGTADHWTPLEQMWVAENAYRSGRGFWPWPNTARSCGLL